MPLFLLHTFAFSLVFALLGLLFHRRYTRTINAWRECSHELADFLGGRNRDLHDAKREIGRLNDNLSFFCGVAMGLARRNQQLRSEVRDLEGGVRARIDVIKFLRNRVQELEMELSKRKGSRRPDSKCLTH